MTPVVFLLLLAITVFTGCAAAPSYKPVDSSMPPSRINPKAWIEAAIAGDGPGYLRPEASPEPVKVENLPKSARGNMSEYTVAGETYKVIGTAKGFVEQGGASWYGRKFHGRLTSSGETYDMYQMTAAHKSLPLPTFVRVTRTDNGASTIVKVNDRGPFVEGRIIDLSYQAASVLGIVESGTAPVRIEALSTHVAEDVPRVADINSATPGSYMQLGAFTQASNAESLFDSLAGAFPVPLLINHDAEQALFRVWVGPVESSAQRNQVVSALQAQGVTNYTMVTAGP